MSTGERGLTADRYAGIRAAAARAVGAAIVRDPPPNREGSLHVPRAVRGWIDDHYADELGEYDPETIVQAVPVEDEAVNTATSLPVSVSKEEVDRRRNLYAAHAVRTDLRQVLEGQEAWLRRAIAVHDALERLVGERGPPTDRRPAEVVEDFADWAGVRRNDASVAEAARANLTPLHVVRVAALDVVDVDGGGTDRDLVVALEEWLSATSADVYRPPDERVTGA